MNNELRIMNNENQSNKIQNFKDLDAWKEGHKLVIMIYKITKTFPKDEIFGIVSQMRRCAVSITSNIYIDRGIFEEIDSQLLKVHKIINGLIKKSRTYAS